MRFSSSSTSAARGLAIAAAALSLFVQSHAWAASWKVSVPCEVPGMRQAILQQVNAVRARGYNCSGQAFGTARPVGWNEQLFSAAAVHSTDMANNNYFAHRSLSGTRVLERAEAQGYKWQSVGENIAAGDTNVPGVMQSWLNSPKHCQAIMDPEYVDVAVACMSRPGTTYGTYWTMVLARR